MSQANADRRAAPGGLPWGAMSILFLAHFVVDSQVSFLSPLLPLLREKLGITLAQGGLLIALLSMSTALSQPITAVVVDRWPRLPWLMVGLVGSAVFLTSVGWLPSFALITAALPLGGCLAGLSHPDMASRAGALSKSRRGLVLSVFITGGRAGFAFGPLIAITVAKGWGMEWLWLYAALAFVAAAAVRRGLPEPDQPAPGGGGPGAGLRAALKDARGPLLILCAVTLLRAIVNVNLLGLLPSLYVELGLGLWRGGAANAVMLFFGGAGVMAGGYLSARFDKRYIIAAGIALGGFSLTAFLLAPARWGLPLLALTGLGMYMPMGVTIALAQELLPGHRGFASGITLGLAWFLASTSVIPFTRAAEGIGLLGAFKMLPGLLILAALLTLRLPPSRERS